MQSKRYGTFSVTQDVVDDHPDVVMAVMGKVIVVRAEYKIATKKIEYEAWSPEFDELDQGAIPPEYDINVDSEGNVSFERSE